jgi:hypothetical protein
VYTTPAFWERLWPTGAIQSLACFIIAYLVYGNQPQVGASADALVAFYPADCCYASRQSHARKNYPGEIKGCPSLHRTEPVLHPLRSLDTSSTVVP